MKLLSMDSKCSIKIIVIIINIYIVINLVADSGIITYRNWLSSMGVYSLHGYTSKDRLGSNCEVLYMTILHIP